MKSEWYGRQGWGAGTLGRVKVQASTPWQPWDGRGGLKEWIQAGIVGDSLTEGSARKTVEKQSARALPLLLITFPVRPCSPFLFLSLLKRPIRKDRQFASPGGGDVTQERGFTSSHPSHILHLQSKVPCKEKSCGGQAEQGIEGEEGTRRIGG